MELLEIYSLYKNEFENISSLFILTYAGKETAPPRLTESDTFSTIVRKRG